MVVRALGNSAASFRDRFNRTGNRASKPFATLSPISASGGNQTPSNGLAPGNGYIYHTFTSPGTFTVNSGNDSIEYIIVAGGGGGANGGGGGGGGLLTNTPNIPAPAAPRRQSPFPVSGPSTYSITVGAGGAPGLKNPGATDGGQGGTSSFGPISATGGGGGSGGDAGPPGHGNPGGSGGGASAETYGTGPFNPGGAATNYPGLNQQGFPGGGAYQYVGGDSSTGGGGGAGAAGQNGTVPGSSPRKSGDGGAGLQFPAFIGPLIGVPSLAPLSGYFAGGGGGGSWGNPGGSGGLGGGVAGAPDGTTPPAAQANTGGGGGGSGYTNPGGWADGGAGGSGIVIIRYLA
jgi:hypothetical protein